MTSVSWIACFVRNNEFIDGHDDLWLGVDAILIPYICLVNDVLLNIFLPDTYQDRTSICLRISWNVSNPNCPAPADSAFAVPAATASPSDSGQSPPKLRMVHATFNALPPAVTMILCARWTFPKVRLDRRSVRSMAGLA